MVSWVQVGSQSIASGPIFFNIVFNTRVDRRTLHLPEISAKKNTRYLSRQKQSVGRLNVVLQADGDHGLLHEWCEKQNCRDTPVIEHMQ